jgi:1-aminocyclopropane-1-carboxylate deaminase/D-cysteine desulfhydrase-like pyridoxal-dependent ACC family enzyme
MTEQTACVAASALADRLARVARLSLMERATPFEKLDRVSSHCGCDVFVKRDDLTPLAMGGNKLRKLEYLAADALAQVRVVIFYYTFRYPWHIFQHELA